MFTKKELKFAYGLAICLFVVGVLCYAAFSATPPERPVRKMFTVTAGNVLFDHQEHASEIGWGISCGDCHHTLEEGEYDTAESCTECHDPSEGDEDVPKRSDALHDQCIGCHQQIEAGPVECLACHVM
jgi:hypothetical protein